MRRALLIGAIGAEVRKTVASRVVLTTSALLVAGIGLLAGSLNLAANSGNERVLTQLGEIAGKEGWGRLLGVVSQITAAGGLLGFGVILSWMVGREFADGTISGLFALPVSRPMIVAAKLAVYLVCALTVTAALVVLVITIGLASGLGPIDAVARDGLARQATLTVLTAGLAVPAAWISTLGRGLLPGIGIVIAQIVVAQVMVVAGTGAWFPVAAPALWAVTPSAVSTTQLALVAPIPLAFGLLTARAWAHLELDR